MKLLRRRSSGTSLVDVVISMGVLVVTAGGLAVSVLSTQKSSGQMAQRDMVRTQALRYVERLLGVPYGVDAAVTATAAEAADFFDDDASMPAGISLMALRTPMNGAGWRFGVSGFEAKGVWEVEINGDLDGNGTLNGIRGTLTPTTGGTTAAGDGASTVTMLSEGRTTLTRIEVFFNGVSVAKTLRSAPVQGT